MQHKPNERGVHDRYYGGFARAVTLADAWLQQMDVECLYGLIGLKTLCERDAVSRELYESVMNDAVGFYRVGLEDFSLYYDPPPSGDAGWHRIGVNESTVYDDPFAYALLSLYAYEGWSDTVQKVYDFINTIRATGQYPAYNPAVCWAGYINVVSRYAACDYYDAVTSGILWRIRKEHDKPNFDFSVRFIEKHQDEFMYWGVKHADYSPVENKKAMATVCWLGQLFLNYEPPVTRFTQVLNARGETVTLYSVVEAGESTSYGEGLDIRALVSPVRSEEVLIESGYVLNDYVTVYCFAPLRHHDKVRRKGEDYEVLSLQSFDSAGETAYFKAVCRRLVG